MEKIHVTTKMNGKMQGMVSINTSSLDNQFCKAMSLVKDSICSKCYSNQMLKMYKTAQECFRRNGELLSSKELEPAQIPFLNYHTVRFNAFGELINKQHFINLVKIAEHNPKTTFTLWTKRMDLVSKRPKNMIIIQSSYKINVKDEKHPLATKTFTVYNDDTSINCKGPCATCMKCYNKSNKTVDIKEKLK